MADVVKIKIDRVFKVNLIGMTDDTCPSDIAEYIMGRLDDEGHYSVCNWTILGQSAKELTIEVEA